MVLSSLIGADLDGLDTPALVVERDAFEQNVRRAVDRLAGRVALRPHLKCAKSPRVAERLIELGAKGICVAKLSEAEVMLDAGLADVLVTTEIVGEVKAARLAQALCTHPGQQVTVVVDSVEGAAQLHEALARADRPMIDALVDVDIGQHRCGVRPGDAAALADRLRDFDRLRVVGVQGYEGHLQHVRSSDERRRLCRQAMEDLDCAVRALRAGGHAVDVVSTGGTGTAEICAEHPVVTEVQPGSFMFMDADYLATSGVGYASALTVVATVISRPADDRVIVDAGLKTLSDDSGPACVRDPVGWIYRPAGDEHGVLTLEGSRGSTPLHVGDRVSLVPSHCDTTINLHDAMFVCHAGKLEDVWLISARGKVQ